MTAAEASEHLIAQLKAHMGAFGKSETVQLPAWVLAETCIALAMRLDALEIQLASLCPGA